jgi:hypothetical protein
MRTESIEEKWDRLGRRIRNLVLRAYPNPGRMGCPGLPVVVNFAKRVANFDDVKEDAEYRHITHCSPCYAEFLDARERLRASEEVSGGPTERFPRRAEKRIGRALEQFERILESLSKSN